MSVDEDVLGFEDEEFIRSQFKEIGGVIESQKREEIKGKGKSLVGKYRRLIRKSSISFDDDVGRRYFWYDEDDEIFDESFEFKFREIKSQESEELVVVGGGGLRRFKIIEFNSIVIDKYFVEFFQKKIILYFDEELELEMESLTDLFEDRFRGEGFSSFYVFSFIFGTFFILVLLFDEDSDSSLSYKKGESKQQRKVRYRFYGFFLFIIEDFFEEEELREEEELLKE